MTDLDDLSARVVPLTADPKDGRGPRLIGHRAIVTFSRLHESVVPGFSEPIRRRGRWKGVSDWPGPPYYSPLGPYFPSVEEMTEGVIHDLCTLVKNFPGGRAALPRDEIRAVIAAAWTEYSSAPPDYPRMTYRD